MYSNVSLKALSNACVVFVEVAKKAIKVHKIIEKFLNTLLKMFSKESSYIGQALSANISWIFAQIK